MRTLGIAVGCCVATAVVVEAIHRWLDTRESLALSAGSSPATRAHPEPLIREQLSRNYAFLGEEGMAKVRNQHVLVVGAGGVGLWVCTMLVRAGVLSLRVVDFDQVTLLLLNRHAVATLADVGTSKVQCLRNHLLEVAPWCSIEAIDRLWDKDSADELVFGNFTPTYVVDCIDNLDTKVDLLAYCHEHLLPVVASMGASCKLDPTCINVGDISTTEEDPLARSVRRRLKLKGILTGIPTVFSLEKPDPRKAKLMPLPEEEFTKGAVGELSALANFRVRILPVLGTMPGVFGLTLATHVLTTVAGYPVEPVEGRNRINKYDLLLASFVAQQKRMGYLENRSLLQVRDVAYAVEEVWKGKLGISGFSTRPSLSRWLAEGPADLQNTVLMTKEEREVHEQRVLQGGESVEAVYSPEVLAKVQQRFAEEKWYSQWR